MVATELNVTRSLSSPVVRIEYGQDGKAILLIGDGPDYTKVSLSYEEICAFQTRVKSIQEVMEWSHASWVFADTISLKKTHLMRKENVDTRRVDRPLCGVKSDTWAFNPVIGEPHDTCCKRCLQIYAKCLKEEVTQTIDCEGSRFEARVYDRYVWGRGQYGTCSFRGHTFPVSRFIGTIVWHVSIKNMPNLSEVEG